MDFSLTDTQRLLVDSVERILAERYSFRDRVAALASPTGWSRTLWNGLAEMGVTGLPFDESVGGHGGNAVDVMLVMQAFGGSLLVEPYLPSIVLAGRAFGKAGSQAQRARYLRPIASGERIAAWAHGEPGNRMDPDLVRTQVERDGAGWRVNGRKSQVLHGASADCLVVSARVGHAQAPMGLFAVDVRAPGVTVHAMRRIDGMPMAEVELRDVSVAAGDQLDAAPDALAVIHEVEDAATAAIVAEAVGAMDAALRLTLDYVKTRKQFGAPIGSFQALQHRAADMHVAIEQARSMAMFAAMSVDEPDPARRGAGVSAAKIVAECAARLVGDSAIQLHGGIGMTNEHPIGHYARKLATLRSSFGDTDFHARRLSRIGSVLEEEL
jgi:alkylation response protein AidB-like acyl-CoA dehydrogenase